MDMNNGSKKDIRKRCFSTCTEGSDNGRNSKRKRRHSISADPSPENDASDQKTRATPTVIVSPRYSQRSQRASVIRTVQSRSQAMSGSRRRCRSTMLPQSHTNTNKRSRYSSSTVHQASFTATKKLNLPQPRKRCQSATLLTKKNNEASEVARKKRCISSRVQPERIEETPLDESRETKQIQSLTPPEKSSKDANASPGTRRRLSLSEVSESVMMATGKRCKSLTRHIQSLEIKA